MTDLSVYHNDIARLAEAPCPYPEGRFAGAGIVICAGGRLYFTCGWVLVNLLRLLGCRLPIEVWYRNPREMNARMRRLLESVEGVRCVDASDYKPDLRLRGWEIKPFAIMHSRFEEVLFIDCDNVPTRDPSFLLHAAPYRKYGAVFWPDRWMGDGDPDDVRTMTDDAWRACGLEPRDEPEFESGQIVINKRRCWRALKLTLFLNAHSDFFYHLVLGDKDTFHLAWRRTGLEYAMPKDRPERETPDAPVLYQHDFEGRRLFQHRNEAKWDYDGHNVRLPGFQHEASCFRLLDVLRQEWDGEVRRYPDGYTPPERTVYDRITKMRLFHYHHDGVFSRLIEMRPDFRIGLGKAAWETDWEIEEGDGGTVELTLRNSLRKMCVLAQTGDVCWAGRCLHFERMPMTVEPITSLPAEQREIAEELRERLLRPVSDMRSLATIEEIERQRLFTYSCASSPACEMEILADHTVGRGASPEARWWFVEMTNGVPELTLWGDRGATCRLSLDRDDTWTGSRLDAENAMVKIAPDPEASRAQGRRGPHATLNYYGRVHG